MKSPKIVVIDYGLGNLFSVRRALEICGAVNVCVTDSEQDITDADRVILPGVGAFSDGMRGLSERALVDPLLTYAKSGKPLLGICLGMQMLASTSEEFGHHKGLNLIPGHVRAIMSKAIDGSPLKLPHIGWSALHAPVGGSWRNSMLCDTSEGTAAYLVHSYAVELDDESNLLAYCEYGGHRIAAAIRSGNVVGCQFHPEKSGPAGLRMLRNFVSWPFD